MNRDGDYFDPARIHGVDMPGLRQLEEGADRVSVTFTELPADVRISYAAEEPALIAAMLMDVRRAGWAWRGQVLRGR